MVLSNAENRIAALKNDYRVLETERDNQASLILTLQAERDAANKRIAELEEALKELDACMDFNEEVQPGEMGIESPENINAAFKKAAALIAQQEQAHD